MRASARSYRHIDAEGTSTPTAPVLTALAEAALAVLARGAMRGHRASGSTHPVGRTASPEGSRPGVRPLRRGPQP